MRTRPRAGTAVLAAIFLLTSAATAIPTAASAAEVEGVTSVSIQPTEAGRAIRDGDQVQVNVTWAVPDTTESGDTFTLSFPPEIRAFTADFTLVNPEGTAVGRCVVAVPDFVCTMNDYVDTHNSVNGGLRFYARANNVDNLDSVEFETGRGISIPATLPGGGGPTPGSGVPSRPDKYGYLRSDGSSVEWTVSIPAASAADANGEPITFTDTWDSRLTYLPSTLRIGYVPAGSWNDGNNWASVIFLSPGSGANTYSLQDRSASSSVSFSFNAPVSDGRVYVVRYSTSIPAGTPDGASFSNSVFSPTGEEVAEDSVSFLDASGEGAGVGVTPPAEPATPSEPTAPTEPATPAQPTVPIAPATPAVPGTPVVPAADGSKALAATGTDVGVAGQLALALLVLGATGLLLARSRARAPFSTRR